ncbi:MAG: LysM repeat protein [Myxococcota bacterium]
MIAALLFLLACGPDAPEVPEPPRYTVVRGDTLFVIAKSHGVTVDDLRSWNGIDGDLIEVGQVLVVGRPGAAAVPATAARPRARRSKPSPAPVTGGVADLSLPAEQPCLDGPTDVAEEHGMAGSAGLDAAQVRAAMGGFVHHTLQCMPDGFSPATPLTLELNVACTGRVSEISIANAGDWPGEVSECVAEVLSYTPFPAHDLPDGETVRYPLRYTAP